MRTTLLSIFLASAAFLTGCEGKHAAAKNYGVDSLSIKNDTLQIFATERNVKNSKQDTFAYRYADKTYDLRYTDATFESRSFNGTYDSIGKPDMNKPFTLDYFTVTDYFDKFDSSQENNFTLDRFALNNGDIRNLRGELNYHMGMRVPGYYYFSRSLERISR